MVTMATFKLILLLEEDFRRKRFRKLNTWKSTSRALYMAKSLFALFLVTSQRHNYGYTGDIQLIISGG